MATILMMSAKMGYPGTLKLEVFWSKGYDVIIYVHDFTNIFLSRGWNYIVDVVMWPKFGNYSISMREVIITSTYKDLTEKTAFFERWSWFKFNNLRLALGTNLKFYTCVAKGLKLKVRKFWELTPTFVEVTWEKLVGWGGLFVLATPVLNRVNVICFSARFCDNSLSLLKMRFQAFSPVSKKVQGFYSDRNILMSLLSLLSHLQNRVSAFLNFNF